ncbi:helix-turn-helix transcriptional regulator [Brevundimonas sp.]|uniref:helix-turn-helix domain-containing protein n=1 Tax=Brevundimonas sp. TaxID=1871086 RepID=UPI00289B950B|nr:helix-turn-helix transcriptional regulator [Brevundimonas sp.]
MAVDNEVKRQGGAAELSARERQCLIWAARGKSSPDIGVILSLSPRTVDSYIEKVCAKLCVRTRIEAVAAAVRLGVIDPQSSQDDDG